MSYVEVVVSLPVPRVGKSAGGGRSIWETTFHYGIPLHLQGDIGIGQLVVVPFGPTERHGLVVSLSKTAPVAETREVLSISDPAPVLSLPHIELARWISRNYLVPLPLAVQLMLPPGLIRRVQLALAPGETAPDDASTRTESERRLLNRLQTEGRLNASAVRQRMGAGRGNAAIDRWVKAGYAVKTQVLAESRARTKTDRLVMLVADDDVIERERLKLGHDSKQADLLCTLLEEGREISAAELLDRAASSDGPLQALRQRGLVAGEGRRAPAGLAVERDEAIAEVIRLRGASRHVAVIDLLRQEDEPVWIGWVYAQTGATLDTLRDLERHCLITVQDEEVMRDPLAGRQFEPYLAPQMTPDQERVWRELEAVMTPDRRTSSSILLHGVTASGKTEIYLRAVERALSHGQGAIVLVPEIALTPQTIHRFAGRFPGQVMVLHGELSVGERYDVWRQIRARRYPVVVGTRSALFAPVPNLGLVVLDEEHDGSYKNVRRPYFHARETATELCRLTGATLLLGSATPDVVTYEQARRGEYRLLELPERVQLACSGGPAGGQPLIGVNVLPPVTVVDMRQEIKSGNLSIFSRPLDSAIREALAARRQIILFLNRRGSASFVMCRDCGTVLRCPRCDVALTFHADPASLRCHHCSRSYPLRDTCPKCGSTRIKSFGLGTEKVVELTAKAFPSAHLLRWDRDVVGERGAHELILDRFARQDADILIGTQMIAKGLDLPQVTVVGVLSADTGLNLPDFRAGERTFQLLTQVAGRAGRGSAGGKVIIQTYAPDHYAIQAASGHDYGAFFCQEIAFRERLRYPPFARLIRLLYTHTDPAQCRRQAELFHHQMAERIARLGLPDVELIGPAPCVIGRIAGRARWQILVRGKNPIELFGDTPLPFGWAADVDPMDLL